MAELVDATDSKPVDASHESSILSPGTDERSEDVPKRIESRRPVGGEAGSRKISAEIYT